jgi:hypothetical protein
MPSTLEIRLAEEFDEHAERYADLALELIEREVPEVIADATRRRLGRDGSAALLRECAGALRHELGAIRYHAPPAALAFGRHLAREGVQLTSILRSYRLGQEVLFARAAELALENPDPRVQVADLARVAALSFRFVDGAMSDVAHEYETQRELFIRGALAQRSTIVKALLAGESVDRELAERTLSYRLDARHVAIVAWSHAGAAEDERVLAAIRELARAFSAGRQLLMTDTPGEATLWTAPAVRPSAEDLQSLLPTGVRAAIGMPAHGPDGFAASKRQADLARSLAEFPFSSTIIRYEDVALAAVMLRDPHAGRGFFQEELRELAHPTTAAAELRLTLAAFYACGQDRTRTAKVLAVHRNTVRRRLLRVEAILGHPLDERARELQAALAVGDVLQPPVSPPATRASPPFSSPSA